jgi:hypothetical protein
MLALSITCNLQASLPVQYWNDNVHKPKSSIQKNIPLKEKCNLTLAMINERKTVNLEKSIPLLMEVYTKEIHTLPEVTLINEHKNEFIKLNNLINFMSKPITYGPLYDIFKSIIENEPLLQKRNLSLNKIHGDIPHFLRGTTATSIQSTIILTCLFNTYSDGKKLHSLHHELQHQLNGDNSNRTLIASDKKQCHLADLKKTAYVQAILKSKVRNCESKNLEDHLHENSKIVKSEISRYEEFRADTRAIEAMHCPHCVQEASMSRYDDEYKEYSSDGYLERWQFQPRIDQLKKQGTICQHHHENGEQVNTSICDGSTLVKRLKIIQK